MRTKDNRFFVREKEYPRIDNFVVLYVGVVLFFQILLQISPVVSALAATPLYNIQTYLGLLGGGLILLDLFTTKRVWQGKFCNLLLAILAGAALSADRMLSYGIKENLFKLCWMTIQFSLVYSCAFRLPKEALEERIKTLLYALLTVWIFACGISFVQYLNGYGYEEVVNPLAKDTSLNKQGFVNNRLYGIFYTLNHAAYVSLFFAIAAAVCALREKRLWVKLCLCVAQVMLIGYIVLSGSRSALVALLVCGLIATGFGIGSRLKISRPWKIVVFCVVILLVIALCCAGYLAMKSGAMAETALDRTGALETTNGRIEIWSNYISLHKEIGLTGLSPGNYMAYILQNHPELHIVYNAKHNFPEKYDAGIIYHVHSGYLMVFVSAGWIGILALAAFMVLCAIMILRKLRRGQGRDLWFICGILIVVAGAISAMFDEGLFFQNNPQTTMFWFALGWLMCDEAQTTTQIQNA